MNASLTARRTASAASGVGARSATANPAPADSFANATASAGNLKLASSSPTFGPYNDANTEPLIATPSVPPTSRLTSLTAEPTPAFRAEVRP